MEFLWHNAPECRSISFFLRGTQAERRYGTFLPAINMTNTSPSLIDFWVTKHSGT